MTRRGFLRSLIVGSVAAIFPETLVNLLKPTSPAMSARDAFLAEVMSSPAGLAARQAPLVLKNSLMHQTIGRKLLLLDELPYGVMARSKSGLLTDGKL